MFNILMDIEKNLAILPCGNKILNVSVTDLKNQTKLLFKQYFLQILYCPRIWEIERVWQEGEQK
jgi:hypothetical protein